MNANADFSSGFSGKTVLVTGGTKGIGAAIATSFLAAGASVAVCGRNEPQSLPEASDRKAHFIAADVRDAGSASSLVTSVKDRFGRLDVLVNNAGGSPDADAATVSPRFFEKIVSLNLLAPFYVAQPANQVMRSQSSGGCIINIGSVSGTDPQPGTAAYSTAKAGLLMLTKALALEWSPQVRVNHITVGLIKTDPATVTEVYGPDGGAALSEVIPMGRMAELSDVTNACLFLASDQASYITGADLPVHGGGEVPARYLITRGD